MCVCIYVENIYMRHVWAFFPLKKDLQLSKQFMVLTPQPRYICLAPPIEHLVVKDAITSPNLGNTLMDDKTQVSWENPCTLTDTNSVILERSSVSRKHTKSKNKVMLPNSRQLPPNSFHPHTFQTDKPVFPSTSHLVY